MIRNNLGSAWVCPGLQASMLSIIGLRVVWTHTLNKWTEGAMFKIYIYHFHALLRTFHLKAHIYY